MARGINKIKETDEFSLYSSGMSIPDVSKATGIAESTLRFRFKKRGILRSRTESIRLAASQGKLGSGMRGKNREFTDEHKRNMSLSKLASGELTAKGVSVKPNGYVEYTRGEHKGRLVHVVVMEERIGRKLKSDEVVHHIDGDKTNNNDNNLALCTKSGHGRLHRREDKLMNKDQRRNADGSWS